MLSLFEVAVLRHPTEKEKKDGRDTELVFGPETLLCEKAEDVIISLAMKGKIAFPSDVNPKQIQVLVRPF